jgi:hypothetical protein
VILNESVAALLLKLIETCESWVFLQLQIHLQSEISNLKEYRASHLGDLMEADTLDVRLLREKWKHFIARDVVSRKAIQANTCAAAITATQFLESVFHRR